MKIVVTGGAGRLGQLTTKELVADGHDVVALDKTPIPDPVCPSAIVDLSRAQELANMFQRADAVIHLARRLSLYEQWLRACVAHMENSRRVRRRRKFQLQPDHQLQRGRCGICCRSEKTRHGIEPHNLRLLLPHPVRRA